jgi:hypothetical protein
MACEQHIGAGWLFMMLVAQLGGLCGAADHYTLLGVCKTAGKPEIEMACHNLPLKPSWFMSEMSQAAIGLSLDTVNAEKSESTSPSKGSICPSTDLCRSFDTVKDLISISIDDPSAFADWSFAALQAFVTAAGAVGMPPPPAWVGQGTLTHDTLRLAMIARVGSVAGGTQGSFCWGPNTQGQYSNVMTLLRDIETDGWMQVHSCVFLCACADWSG